ncbi:fumagillin beta-trans-bergamotene synthase af520 [Colletotrichum spaethianum]|uniref:Fumagillin beta-trans-bergamotene synthase af520 n=1 Tax=Colletotrichum spaethianum TaxID=700344 RepID=A0AA37P9M5_9PEZI|nr:fumagillin beta-trans-bergamotene synthase af520 [Colletotrichum spaethianum]GKT48192.1 fumagillin beta-trans-bergamotene synthase af520 [Colletotrichum spaethianum]
MANLEETVLLEKPSGAGSSDSVTFGVERMNLIVKVQRGVFHFKTLYLFTRSDIKTVLAPQIIFILSAVLSRQPLTTVQSETMPEAVQRLPLAIVWIWLNLVVCGISNQRLENSIIEDGLNKPWRPLAAKRLTPEQAQRLLLGMIPLVVGTSAVLGGFKPTLSMMTLLWMYNDLDGSSINIWARNAINTGGIMCFSAGSLEVLSRGELLPKSWAWIGLTGAAIATTVQALDFPDMEGDRARGRKTIPLLYGETVARGGLVAMVLIWSIVCPMFWELRPVFWAAPVGVGILMAVLTMFRRDEKSDNVVAKLWCLWISVLYILPLFTR